jgi:hypothetical protein
MQSVLCSIGHQNGAGLLADSGMQTVVSFVLSSLLTPPYPKVTFSLRSFRVYSNFDAMPTILHTDYRMKNLEVEGASILELSR